MGNTGKKKDIPYHPPSHNDKVSSKTSDLQKYGRIPTVSENEAEEWKFLPQWNFLFFFLFFLGKQRADFGTAVVTARRC